MNEFVKELSPDVYEILDDRDTIVLDMSTFKIEIIITSMKEKDKKNLYIIQMGCLHAKRDKRNEFNFHYDESKEFYVAYKEMIDLMIKYREGDAND